MNNFRDFLTLSPEFFATFAQATCSLSVLYPYLTLEGVYLLFGYVLPNISTLWKIHSQENMKVWDYHPLWQCVPAHLLPHLLLCKIPNTTYQTHMRQIIVWAGSVSLAVTKDILVSFFPPLIDMLKFRGLTHLSWGNKIFKKKFFKIFKKFEKVWSRPHSQKDSKIPSSLYYHRDQILFKNFKYFEYLGKRLSCPKHKPNFPTPQKIFWHYNSASVTFVSLAKCMFFWQVYVFLYVTVFWE